MAPMFGYGLGISDICVTVGTREFDCLQKIYPVGRFIAVGFSGSVEIGFAMAETLASLLSQAPATDAWDPNIVASWWPADARRIFACFPPETQRLGCELILIGVHPFENLGDVPWARSYVHIFRAPDFNPKALLPNRVDSIGSGIEAANCRSALERLTMDEDHLAELLVAGAPMPGGIATILGMDLTKLLQSSRPAGVSAHLHFCVVERGRITIMPNDHEEWGATPTVFRMPRVATSWNELKYLLSATGVSAAGATT